MVFVIAYLSSHAMYKNIEVNSPITHEMCSSNLIYPFSEAQLAPYCKKLEHHNLTQVMERILQIKMCGFVHEIHKNTIVRNLYIDNHFYLMKFYEMISAMVLQPLKMIKCTTYTKLQKQTKFLLLFIE